MRHPMHIERMTYLTHSNTYTRTRWQCAFPSHIDIRRLYSLSLSISICYTYTIQIEDEDEDPNCSARPSNSYSNHKRILHSHTNIHKRLEVEVRRALIRIPMLTKTRCARWAQHAGVAARRASMLQELRQRAPCLRLRAPCLRQHQEGDFLPQCACPPFGPPSRANPSSSPCSQALACSATTRAGGVEGSVRVAASRTLQESRESLAG